MCISEGFQGKESSKNEDGGWALWGRIEKAQAAKTENFSGERLVVENEP